MAVTIGKESQAVCRARWPKLPLVFFKWTLLSPFFIERRRKSLGNSVPTAVYARAREAPEVFLEPTSELSAFR